MKKLSKKLVAPLIGVAASVLVMSSASAASVNDLLVIDQPSYNGDQAGGTITLSDGFVGKGLIKNGDTVKVTVTYGEDETWNTVIDTKKVHKTITHNYTTAISNTLPTTSTARYNPQQKVNGYYWSEGSIGVTPALFATEDGEMPPSNATVTITDVTYSVQVLDPDGNIVTDSTTGAPLQQTFTLYPSQQ